MSLGGGVPWGLIPNICPGQGEHPLRLLSRPFLVGEEAWWQQVRQAGIKTAFINFLSAEGEYDLWCQNWGPLRCQIRFPEASVLQSWRPVTALAAAVCITLLPPPTSPDWSMPYLRRLPFPLREPSIRPHICFSLRPPHVSEDLNALTAGTSAVSLWHLTQRLGDLKGRGANYSKWSVTEIKNHPSLPPITLNNAVWSICWSDVVLSEI